MISENELGFWPNIKEIKEKSDAEKFLERLQFILNLSRKGRIQNKRSRNKPNKLVI